jgi:hypothetical protein
LIESERCAITHKHFLITPKILNEKTEYVHHSWRMHLWTTEEIIALFAEEGFSVKAHIPSFAMKGRDLIIFESLKN